jgi:nucleoside-diphosphate-sugar epimerase
MKGQRILITGATGRMGLPLALSLAPDNEVYALARFTDVAAKATLEAAGARTVAFDLAEPALEGLPEGIDYVLHTGGFTPSQSDPSASEFFEVNAQAVGRLMERYRDVKGFLHCSSGSVYAYQGRRPLREEDPYGVHIGLYSLSKIAGEEIARFASRRWDVPTTIIRIFSAYSARGGSVTDRIERMVRGKPIPLYPDGPNRYNPMYEEDYVALAPPAVELARVPPLVLNFGGSETMPAEDYLAYAGELLGLTPEIRYVEALQPAGLPVFGLAGAAGTGGGGDSAYWPLWPDLTRMHALLGRTRVGVREGIRRVVAARYGR